MHLLTTLAFLTFTSATPLILERDDVGCCFHLTASGGPGGNVGQLGDGQNRIGQSNLPTPQGSYCLNNGGLTDQSGRGCILTPPTTQWQCDVGAAPTTGFSVGCDGNLQHNGSTTFYTCPTGDNGGWNIYSQPVLGQPACVEVTLQSDNGNCNSGCPAPSSGCPRDLPASFEFPHLILPIDSVSQDRAFPNSYNGTACGGISSIFNFDIPPSDAGKQCTLELLLPRWDQLQTSTFWLSGSDTVRFASLKGPAVEGQSYSTAPNVDTSYGSVTLTPGNAYTVATFPCPANTRYAVAMFANDDTCFSYFQDWNPCPIGLYITTS